MIKCSPICINRSKVDENFNTTGRLTMNRVIRTMNPVFGTTKQKMAATRKVLR